MTMEFKCRPLLRPRPQSMTGPLGSLFGREMHRYPSGIAPLPYASWVALASIAGCSAKEEEPAPPPLGATIAAVVQKDVPIRQEWVGTMVGNVDAEIRPKVEGFLLTRLYTEGSYVEKGQPMFHLDSVEPGSDRCAALYASGSAKGFKSGRTGQSYEFGKGCLRYRGRGSSCPGQRQVESRGANFQWPKTGRHRKKNP